MRQTDSLISVLKSAARDLGFDAFGISQPQLEPDISRALREFVAKGHHGSMSWMKETLERRSNPTNLWPDVKSIIVVAMNYGPEADPLRQLENKEQGTISVYARHRDYHDVIKGRLKTLAAQLSAQASRRELQCDVKVFVDTAPVMEKPLAQQAGLGWQGKHTNLVSREFGSWLFLGSIFTTLELPADDPETDHCGSCSNCLDVCPTNAFPAPYQMDARRCISYLTIESREPVPLEFRKPMGNRIYGCDDCLAVCPWNKFAQQASEAKLSEPLDARPSELQAFLELDDAQFRARFSGSPVKRIGRDRFVRNCLIAAGNSGINRLIPLVQNLNNDSNEVVREAADWAMGELTGEEV